MKSWKHWALTLTACIALALGFAAAAERITTFAWDAAPTWPPGTTVELCGNGPTCLTGLTGLSATMTLPVNPGEVIQGMARAIPPPGYQCGEPLADCPPSAWATVAQTWPAAPTGRQAWKEEVAVADPTYQGSGTLEYRAGNNASSFSTTITNVEVGDLLVVQVQRDGQANITGVASTSPALTFTRQARANTGYGSGFQQDVYTAIATTAASSMTITASYSDSQAWGSMISFRWSGGVSSGTATHSASDSAIRATSTSRTAPNITTTQRTLLLAVGSDWDFYLTHTAAANWTKILDSQTKGTDSTTMYLHARIADAGTYPSGNFATTNDTDQYFGSIIALPVDVVDEKMGGSATAVEITAAGAGERSYSALFTEAPSVTAKTVNSYTLGGTLSEEGHVFAVAVLSTDAAPTTPQQIILGHNGDDDPARGAGDAATDSEGVFSFNVTGGTLGDNPIHNLHVVGRVVVAD